MKHLCHQGENWTSPEMICQYQLGVGNQSSLRFSLHITGRSESYTSINIKSDPSTTFPKNLLPIPDWDSGIKTHQRNGTLQNIQTSPPPPKKSSTNLSVVHAVLKYSHIAFPAKTCFKSAFERCCTGQVAIPSPPSDILKISIDISTHPPEIVPKPSSKQVVWNCLNPS